MKSHLTTIVLLGALATTPALAGERGASPTPRAADAQVQAALLLKHEALAPTPAHAPLRASAVAVRGQPAGAQSQAARLLRGEPSFASTTPQRAGAGMHRGRWNEANRGAKGAASQDAQAQAQGLLRAQSPPADNALEVHVVAVSP